MPELLRMKNGVVMEDVAAGVAAAIKKIHADDQPRPIEVPQAELWLSQRASEIRDHDQAAQSLSIEKDQIARKLDSIRAGARPSYGGRSAMEAQAEKADRLVQHYEGELVELDRRIKRSTDLAAQVRRAVAEFHENHPEWPKVLREYKTAGALGEQGILGNTEPGRNHSFTGV